MAFITDLLTFHLKKHSISRIQLTLACRHARGTDRSTFTEEQSSTGSARVTDEIRFGVCTIYSSLCHALLLWISSGAPYVFATSQV